VPGETIRLRIQFCVVDNAAGPAPAGGFIGWNLGALSLNNGQTGSRTPGRLSPFDFAPDPPGNGVPSADPFTSLTDIDNTLGIQSPPWVCNPDGTIPPQPGPVIRGRNTFVSTFEFSTVISTVFDFTANFSGNLIAATGWNTIECTPPDCGDPADPSDDIPGTCLYVPVTLPPQTFSDCVRLINIPAPSAALLCFPGWLAVRRRRRA
jgi:hypothetical protein